jgi:mannitol-specific phosphotransferase system IIBC component
VGAFSSVVLKNIEKACREKVSAGLSKLVTNELSSFAVGTLAGMVLAF